MSFAPLMMSPLATGTLHAWPMCSSLLEATLTSADVKIRTSCLVGHDSRHDSGQSCTTAGIGRSGVLCTVAIALKRLRAADPRDGAACRHAVNVKRIVAQLRTQRRGMVQNAEQYQLCHQVRPASLTHCIWESCRHIC